MDSTDFPAASQPSGADVLQFSTDSLNPILGENDLQPRAKRIACVLCRKRKLRCDGARPKCATCSRLSHDCSYDVARKKSGPKRGYVKHLEARLQQVETLLHTDAAANSNTSAELKAATTTASHSAMSTSSKAQDTASSAIMPEMPLLSDSMDLIGLGLEEVLPPPEVIADLHDLYFEKVHKGVPMLSQSRYLSALLLGSPTHPPICLRYIIWAAAASVSDKYLSLAELYYRRARKYMEADEMKGHGEAIVTVGHCQAWILISLYEFKNMYFPRAWQSTGRASSLAIMMNLNRIDGSSTGVKQRLAPAKDWVEMEERRRTFWLAFNGDRYASIGTGWSFRLDELDITTHLPASDYAFNLNIPEMSCSLEEVLSLSGNVNISPIASVVLMTCLLGRNLTHLHRPTDNDDQANPNGEFWQRHRRLENLLAHIGLALPDHLRIPAGLPDPNIIFMNLLLQTAVICLHEAAIFKAEANGLSQEIVMESRARCMTGASEITRIMKMLSHIDMSPINPFMAFCLYVAARVFVECFKWQPGDQNVTASLKFLGSAMHLLSRKNPLTMSFLAQLQVDLEGTGLYIAPQASSVWVSNKKPCGADDNAAADSDQSVFMQPDYATKPAPVPVNPAPAFSSTSESSGNLHTYDMETPFTVRSSHSDLLGTDLPHRSKGQSPATAANLVAGDATRSPNSSDLPAYSNVDSRSNSYQNGTSDPSRASTSDVTDEIRARSDGSSPASAEIAEMTEGMFFDVANERFANIFGSQVYPSAVFPPSASDKVAPMWSFGMDNMGSGLTPAAEGDWDEVLRRQNYTG